MKKPILILSLAAATMLSACDNNGSDRVGGNPALVDDFSNGFENAPLCGDRVITTYNRVINQANQFAWNGRTRNLRNLVIACGELRQLMGPQSCVASDLSNGELILVSYNDLRTVCDQANLYNGTYDKGRTGMSSKSGEQRRQNFNLGKMQDKDGIAKAPKGPRGEQRRPRPEGSTRPSGPRGR